MLALGSFGELVEVFSGGWFVELSGSSGFCARFFSADGTRDDGADDLLKWGAVVGGDPFCKLEE